MTKYREIIRLTGLGFSQRNIMARLLWYTKVVTFRSDKIE